MNEEIKTISKHVTVIYPKGYVSEMDLKRQKLESIFNLISHTTKLVEETNKLITYGHCNGLL